MPKREWHLQRNCSLTPGQTACAYAIPCLIALAVSIMFLLQGTWIVLAFALLEAGGFALAFAHYALHAGDFEHVMLANGRLLIVTIEGGRASVDWFDPCWTRIVEPRRPQALIYLESKGRTVALGRFVAEATRVRVARELRVQLAGRAAG
jgi:uncharacterized membrane protein